MKRRAAFTTTGKAPTADNTSTMARTGEHCPETGWWTTITQDPGIHVPHAPRFITEGSLMPAIQGTPATWVRAIVD